tara:strand:- start:22 stop:279 length:258 start_codon:yes stop_codon:yes gene_type:complete
MSITGSIVTYVILWWIVLFLLLPFKIKSQLDDKNIYPGTEPGAPSNPRILKKVFYTTIITSILFTIIFILSYFNVINIRDFLTKL